tara:strand:- start:357 stop:887 length:531 start_codon:yes stop_codon:yes gene_type:complete
MNKEKEYHIHQTWKRLEVLNIIYKLSIDIKAYCYLNKYDLNEKLTSFILTNNYKLLFFLFSAKPTRKIKYYDKTILTQKARKVCNYCRSLSLEYSGYFHMDEVHMDIEDIKGFTDICSVNKAIKQWNKITGNNLKTDAYYSEYEMTIEEQKKIRQQMLGLNIKRGKFVITFEWDDE